MKLYIVSSCNKLLFNSGLIKSTHRNYESAFEKAQVGEYIHEVNVLSVEEIRAAGKIAVKIAEG